MSIYQNIFFRDMNFFDPFMYIDNMIACVVMFFGCFTPCAARKCKGYYYTYNNYQCVGYNFYFHSILFFYLIFLQTYKL